MGEQGGGSLQHPEASEDWNWVLVTMFHKAGAPFPKYFLYVNGTRASGALTPHPTEPTHLHGPHIGGISAEGELAMYVQALPLK